MFSPASFNSVSFNPVSFNGVLVIEPPVAPPANGGGSSGIFISPLKIKRRVKIDGEHEGFNVGTGELMASAAVAGRFLGMIDATATASARAAVASTGDAINDAPTSGFRAFTPPTERQQLQAALIVNFLRNKIRK
jgi:hypothetical protein